MFLPCWICSKPLGSCPFMKSPVVWLPETLLWSRLALWSHSLLTLTLPAEKPTCFHGRTDSALVYLWSLFSWISLLWRQFLCLPWFLGCLVGAVRRTQKEVQLQRKVLFVEEFLFLHSQREVSLKVLLLFQTFPCMCYHSDSTVPSCKAGTAFASNFKAPPSSSDPQGHLRTWRPQSFLSLRFEREEAAVQFSLHIPIPPLCARGMFVPV